MTDQERRLLPLANRGHYVLPEDLVFEGLAAGRGTALIRLRFSRSPYTTIDLPLSAGALEHLAQEIGLLYGKMAAEMSTELADLHSKGLQIRD